MIQNIFHVNGVVARVALLCPSFTCARVCGAQHCTALAILQQNIRPLVTEVPLVNKWWPHKQRKETKNFFNVKG